ncbi:LuxR C-terminal-related transcriptional regulator [Kitasatospora sp. NPDC018619]|uniref:LuxR C-terminal-related transcriptional regulator n=1 Tax=unclassified Kitasatospora TaxID=2633591 RepID=UPI0037BE07A3
MTSADFAVAASTAAARLPEAGPPGTALAPAATDPFPLETVGRAGELAEVLAVLERPDVDGVLLSGAPGIGKSRLAQEAALAHQARTGATVGRIVPAPGSDWADGLRRWITRARESGDAPPVLLLDGGRRDPDRRVLARLARALAGTGAKALVTARRPVAQDGFAHRSVPPLPVPLDCCAIDVEALASVPSVELFVACLRAFNPAFRIGRHNQLAVARTCVELHGNPGSIGLAARIAALEGPEVLWAALDGQSRAGTLPDRPRPGVDGLARLLDAYGPDDPDPEALRDLSQAGRRLLACARVFSGGAGPESLRQISGVGLDEYPAALEALLDRHLLSLSALPSGRLDGYTRTRLHLSFGRRSYRPQEQTAEAAPGPEDVRLAHARHHARLAASAVRLITDGPQARGIIAFRSEEGNIRRALDTLVTAGLADEALDLAELSRVYHYAIGTPFDWPAGLASLGGPGADREIRRRTALLLAEAAVRDDEPEAALAVLDGVGAGGAGHEAPADGGFAARTRHLRGIAVTPSRPDEGLALLHRAVEPGADGSHLARRRLLDAALAEFLHRCADTAATLATRALAEAIQAGDSLVAGLALLHLSAFAAAAGRAGDSANYLDRAVSALRPLGAPAALGALLALMGSPLLPGRAARAAAVARALGCFHAVRRHLLDDPTEPDFTVGRAEGRLLPGDRDSLAAMAAGALVELPELIQEFALGCAAVRTPGERPEPVPGRPAAPPSATAAAAAVPPSGSPLTRRQIEVARLIAEGLSNKQIARQLAISEWTVVNHIRETMRKLDCSSRVAIAGWVHRTVPAPGER